MDRQSASLGYVLIAIGANFWLNRQRVVHLDFVRDRLHRPRQPYVTSGTAGKSGSEIGLWLGAACLAEKSHHLFG